MILVGRLGSFVFFQAVDNKLGVQLSFGGPNVGVGVKYNSTQGNSRRRCHVNDWIGVLAQKDGDGPIACELKAPPLPTSDPTSRTGFSARITTY